MCACWAHIPWQNCKHNTRRGHNMSSDFIASANAGIQALQPYEPGKPIEELERELGITDIVKLASNESPIGPSPKAMAAAKEALQQLHRYPDGDRKSTRLNSSHVS